MRQPVIRPKKTPAWSLLVLVCGVVFLAGAPLAEAVLAVLQSEAPFAWRRWMRWSWAIEGLAWAAAIGLGSLVPGWPLARLLARPRGRAGAALAALAVLPVLLPSYLAYSGYGVLRDPGLATGDWILRRQAEGWRGLSSAVGAMTAYVGLVLAASPLAAMGIATSMVGETMGEREARMLEPGRGRLRQTLMRHRAGLVAGFALVAILMLGSPLPLHLAQVDTWTIALWRALAEQGRSAGGAVWVAAAPSMLVAAAAAAALVRTLHGARAEADEPGAVPPRSRVLGGLVILLAVVAPLLLYAVTLRDLNSLWSFWRLNGDALGRSVLVGAAVGGVSMVLSLAALAAAGSGSRWHRRAALAAGVILAAWAVSPGVLIGQAWNALSLRFLAFEALAPVIDRSPAVVIAAHLTRFAAIPVLVALLLAAGESVERRWLRAADGVRGWRWFRAADPARLAGVAGGAVVAGVLSVHEVEATVFVQTPGWQMLATVMLGHLHFSRMDELAAGAIWLVLLLTPFAVGGAWLIAGGGRRHDRGRAPRRGEPGF